MKEESRVGKREERVGKIVYMIIWATVSSLSEVSGDKDDGVMGWMRGRDSHSSSLSLAKIAQHRGRQEHLQGRYVQFSRISSLNFITIHSV